MSTRPSYHQPAHGHSHPSGEAPGRTTLASGPRESECVPCEIAPFCRNNYFTGKLLTERDFKTEQRYLRDKVRLHSRALHGWGVACGLRVKPHPYCPELKIIVEPGLAIDECGYEIVVPRDVELDLPRSTYSHPQAPEPCPPEPEPSSASTEASSIESSYGPRQEPSRPAPPSYGEETAPRKPEPRPYPEPRCSYYVCLSYAECETEFAPAPFDECGCTGSDRLKPNRICESYRLELKQGEPDRPTPQPTTDCKDLYDALLEPCREPTRACCIPLAFIRDYAAGERLTPARIDNTTYRPLLPSVRLHDDLIRCILDTYPSKASTHVRDIGWTHGEEYRCRDFMRLFVGDSPSAAAFEVTFDGPVRADGLSPRSFQAVVVRHPDEATEGGYQEVAPSRVWASSDGRKFFLQIDRSYAERSLDGARFDVFVTLRCNLVLDQRGVPVDGDLLARLEGGTYVVAPPTGDGVPGGTLESWIRVRP